MWLSELLENRHELEQDVWVLDIALDSREVQSGSVFFALAGHEQHGLQFSLAVEAQGAVAIVYDPKQAPLEKVQAVQGIPVLVVENLGEKLGSIAACFYGNPSEKLAVIGITGTNGKTSCSQFLAQMLESTAVIGTLGNGLISDLQPSKNTTPDAFVLQKLLADFRIKKIKQVAMEVSSHALVQGRVNAIQFKGAVFNNLSRDHLDYHGDMEHYLQAKMYLLRTKGLEFAVVNFDDAYAEQVLSGIDETVRVLTYSLGKNPYSKGSFHLGTSQIHYTMTGIECLLNWQGQSLPLSVAVLGDFNLQNVLAALGVLLMQGFSLVEVSRLAEKIRPINGRMQCFSATENQPMIVVDYAHTPDALAKALTTLRVHCIGQLTVVFGCGGNRDIGKRALMGDVACHLADNVIITDDNPRFESAQKIIEDIMSGISGKVVRCIHDRKRAIAEAIRESKQGDVVLIAGKGHEDYQEVQGVRAYFSDQDCVREQLNKL